MLNPIFNIYINKAKTKKLKKFKFKGFKKVMPLKVFKKHYIKDFYTPYQLSKLKEIFNIDQVSLDMALIKRSILNKIVTRKYYAIFFPKEFPNRFPKRIRKYRRRKKKKKNLRLRLKFFYSIPQDNFLFYLTILDKQLLIKPFNFLNCLFFFKMRKFKKVYVVRQRRRLRFRFYYKFGRRKRKRRSVRRRRRRYLKYKFKYKFLMRKLRRIKIRKYKNFLRFISFFNTCKKITLNIDDYFKVNSLLNLTYRLLKFNFNKLTNSYNFFLNFNGQRKSKINISNIIIKTRNLFNKPKKKLYNIIQFKLKNRFILNNNNKQNQFFDFDFLTNQIGSENQNLKFKINDYLNYNNVIKNAIFQKSQINLPKNNIKNSQQNNQFSFILKLIYKILKKINFFEQKLINFKMKEKRKLSLLFLKFFNSNNRKLLKEFKKYKQILNILFDIILKLKNKLKDLIIMFYILYFNNYNGLTFIKKNKSRFFKKILFLLNRAKLKAKKIKKKLIFIFFKNKARLLTYSGEQFKFSYKNKINNKYSFKRRWKIRKMMRIERRAKKRASLQYIKKNFIITNLFFYKNNPYSYLGNRKFKSVCFNFLQKSDIQHLVKKKNINFLK